MRTFYSCVVFVVISLAFFACKKDKSDSKGQLVMIRTTWGDSIGWRTFSYDAQNRLSVISDSNNNGSKRKMVISYDAQGKLSQATNGIAIFKFDYDNRGRVARKLLQYQGQPTASVMDTYSYDANDRVIADTAYDTYWTNGIYSIVSYSYDAAGNVNARKFWESISGIVWKQEQQCSYDGHRNPLDGKTIMLYLFDSEEGNLPAGKNNLLKQTFDDGTFVTYQYSYRGDGLPKNCTYFDNTDPMKTFVEYFYE